MALLESDDVATIEPWLDEHWDPSLTVGQWWQLLADARLSTPGLPAPCGRGWTRDQTATFIASLLARDALLPPGGMGVAMVAPTLVDHASAELQQRFLP